jgi:hypothetical protein
LQTHSTSWKPLVALALLAGVVLMAQLSSPASGATGPRLIASDVALNPNPIPFWQRIECESRTRHRHLTGGGDLHLTGLGVPQGNVAHRRLTLFDGDSYYGERCELGYNNRHSRVAFYGEGMRRITYFSLRFPGNFPLKTKRWQVVMQMKQSTPADNSGGAPVLALFANRGRWELWHSPPGYTLKQNLLWSRRARKGAWTRFAFHVRYSRKRSRGRIRVFADLNGDGDFGDPGERGRRRRTNTLKVETAGSSGDGYRQGQSLRSHLRLGIYHDTGISCPRPQGCSVDIDNVQVIRP